MCLLELRPVGLGSRRRLRLAGPERIVAVDLSEDAWQWPATTAPPTRCSRRRRGRRDKGANRRLRLRLHLRGHRPRQGHAPGGEDSAANPAASNDDRRGRQGPGPRNRAALPDHRPPRDGSSFGGVKGRSQVPGLVQLWTDGKLDVDSMLSHRMPLADVNRAFDLMHNQDGIRTILTFWNEGSRSAPRPATRTNGVCAPQVGSDPTCTGLTPGVRAPNPAVSGTSAPRSPRRTDLGSRPPSSDFSPCPVALRPKPTTGVRPVQLGSDPPCTGQTLDVVAVAWRRF